MPESIIDVLKSIPLFATAQEETLAELAPTCIFQAFSAGIEINRVGEVPRFIYCLRSGSIEGWSRLKTAETIVATACAPMVFEVTSAMTNHPSQISIVTREPAETLAITANAFLKAVKSDPKLCHAALVHASEVNLIMIDRLLDQKLRTAEQRLAQWVLAEIERHGATRSFNITYSKRALAYELGMSPANLSRLFNVIRDHGVDLDGKTMRITDMDKLTALAHS
ncbi:hypothetical protein ASG72_05830 [Bosea sp. Leaf344]|uniref:helix-turn-helix domain-containing protein n=1 Tax=Bosea sp. Leaf344 TaxID=1736346 RepID=UPI0006FA6867|nr:helix-turn-helix domain-containing protein [Bosea sp. Leaf344]KQU52458.1 hypothetical protein ASG72_05830 [Bosea sp. Leaf344]